MRPEEFATSTSSRPEELLFRGSVMTLPARVREPEAVLLPPVIS
jgi:hypothetical protein